MGCRRRRESISSIPSRVHNYSDYAPWRASHSGFLRGPSTEELQAELVDTCYRVLMGKPFIEAIASRDFCDAYRHFFTRCWLDGRDLAPTRSYGVLLKLAGLRGAS